MREKKLPLGEYLAFLSVKYSVDPDNFFQVLISASIEQVARYGKILVECRGIIEKEKVLLLTHNDCVIAQLRVPLSFLSEKCNPIKKFMDSAKIRRFIGKHAIENQSRSIKDLRVGMNHVNLSAVVLKIPAPTYVFTRFGNNAVVTNVLIGDATGSIKLCLWNDQIDRIAVGDNIEIQNGRTFAFRGEKQLRIGSKGSLKIQQTSIAKA
ncbi:MAG: hypothetical protein QXU99_00150 [Candidatus Bathyarchaeia archaeon]